MTFAVHADAWLAELMARPVFRVDGGGDTAALAAHVKAHPGFYFGKVATDRIADVAALAALGFVVVDTNVTFELAGSPAGSLAGRSSGPGELAGSPAGSLAGRSSGPGELAPAAGFDVGECTPADADGVLAIAGSAFRYSRFHLDPQIEPALAHRIKREWIQNYVLGKRGDALLVARAGGTPVGFLAALVSHGTAVIDLVAVASDAHGRGAGSALTAAFIQRYRGMPRIVGTQIANVPSIRLYTKLGFVLAKSTYVLHLHT